MPACRSTVLALLVVAGGTPAAAADGFCTRLAPQLGLSPKKDATGSYWQKNTLNPMQRLVVGGTSIMSFGVEPVGQATEAERQRLDGMCAVEKKGIMCNVAGPARIKAALGEDVVKVEALPGERAKLWTSGSRVRCQDVQPI